MALLKSITKACRRALALARGVPCLPRKTHEKTTPSSVSSDDTRTLVVAEHSPKLHTMMPALLPSAHPADPFLGQSLEAQFAPDAADTMVPFGDDGTTTLPRPLATLLQTVAVAVTENHTEGLFRVSGKIDDRAAFWQGVLDAPADAPLAMGADKAVMAADYLKIYLRSLPERVIPLAHCQAMQEMGQTWMCHNHTPSAATTPLVDNLLESLTHEQHAAEGGFGPKWSGETRMATHTWDLLPTSQLPLRRPRRRNMPPMHKRAQRPDIFPPRRGAPSAAYADRDSDSLRDHKQRDSSCSESDEAHEEAYSSNDISHSSDDDDDSDDSSASEESLSFAEIAQRREAMGTKAYKEMLAQKTAGSGQHAEKPKRPSKHAPMEISSKKPVSRKRQVVDVAKSKRRDPRFDDMCGHLNEDLFKKSYAFLDDVKQREITELRRQLAACRDPAESQRLMQTLQAMENRARAHAAREDRQRIKREWRKRELDRIQEGHSHRPFFLKRSEQAKLVLINKLRGMSDKELDKVAEKKRKRDAAKDRKFVPRRRTEPTA